MIKVKCKGGNRRKGRRERERERMMGKREN